MEENFEELLNKSVQELYRGKIIKGTVIKITDKKEIFVDLGYKADGIIPYNEYTDKENVDISSEINPGDEIEVEILKMNDGVGNVLLSYKRPKYRKSRKEFEKKVKNRDVIKDVVKTINEKGLIVEHNGIRIFIPFSLSEISRNEDKNSYIGKQVEFIITEYEKGKIIGSIKEVKDIERKELQENFWENAEVGKKYTGTVKAISSYGAFVELEKGVQGLLHISEMTWERNANPKDILKEDQKVEVEIKEIDKENKRLKLILLTKGVDPWNTVDEKYKINDIVKVTIKKILNFGVFAELEPGIEGLIHISQISTKRISKPEEKLKINQEVNAKILNIDTENKKIELSIKELEGTSNDLEYKEEIEKLEKEGETENE